MTDFSPESLKKALKNLFQARRWLVGFSGGLDSTVLLHALNQLHRQERCPEIIAIHINHGLSAKADKWQKHCQQQCEQWNLPCVAENVKVAANGDGVEAAARQSRFGVFQHHVGEGDVLLLAQHRDDQAETVLLRLLRGSGSKGLAAMARCRQFGEGSLVRPLLDYSRQQIAAYSQDHQLTWVDDDSNTLDHFDRNFLRNNILPQLEQRWPELNQRLARTASIFGDDASVLTDMAAVDLDRCGVQQARLGWKIDIKTFRELSPNRRHNLVRYWCESHGMPILEYKHCAMLDKAMEHNDDDKLCLQWPGVQLRQHREFLYLLPSMPNVRSDQVFHLDWQPDTKDVVDLSNGSYLALSPKTGGISCKSALSVRFRRGGERCQPAKRQHSQVLKKLLQEYQLEPWLRDCVPLFYVGEELAAVADLWVCRRFQALPDEPGLELKWTFPKQKKCFF